MRVFVTGGSGFIGIRLVRALLARQDADTSAFLGAADGSAHAFLGRSQDEFGTEDGEERLSPGTENEIPPAQPVAQGPARAQQSEKPQEEKRLGGDDGEN